MGPRGFRGRIPPNRASLAQIRPQLGRKSLPLKQHLAVFERVFRLTCDPMFAGIAIAKEA